MLLVAGLINFGVKNQVPKVSFKITVGDLMSVSSYKFAEIKFCDSLDILEPKSYYGSQAFALHGPRPHLRSFLITCSSPHSASKDG